MHTNTQGLTFLANERSGQAWVVSSLQALEGFLLIVYNWLANPFRVPGACSFRRILLVPRSLSFPGPGARFNPSIQILRSVAASLDGRVGSEQPDLLWEAVSQREMSRILCYPWIVQAFLGLRVPLAFRTVKHLICFVFPEFWSTWMITLWNTILMKIPSSCRLKRLEDLTSWLWLRSKITDHCEF